MPNFFQLNYIPAVSCNTVKKLTYSLSFLAICNLLSCSFIKTQLTEQCNSRSYIAQNLESYITRRFSSQAPVRMGILPLATPANFTYQANDLQGIGHQIARRLQSEFISRELAPIIEVFPRADIPASYDDFYNGNYVILDQARSAGYDLIFVGALEPIHALEELTASAKLIEVDSGTTIWSGKTRVTTNRGVVRNSIANLGLMKRRPDYLYFEELLDGVAVCLTEEMGREQG